MSDHKFISDRYSSVISDKFACDLILKDDDAMLCEQWLQSEAGMAYPRVIGGYKAMRRFLLDNLAMQARERRFLVLSGQTGCAKTDLLAEVPGAIDLEGLANHRGSAFGKRVGGQPSQIGFENALSIALLRNRQAHGDAPVLLEDESRLIGRVAVPEGLRERTLGAPVTGSDSSTHSSSQPNCALVLRFEPRIEVCIVVASRRCSAACSSL